MLGWGGSESVSRARNKKRLPLRTGEGVCCKKPGETYFRTFGTIIGSKSLTTVFGMGTGVTFSI
mgnify:CR=1 FL=1